MVRWIGLDFETYSGADLTKVGLANYVQHPTFRPLLAAVAERGRRTSGIDFTDFDHGIAQLWGQVILPVQDRKARIVAHNAGFEREVLRAIGYELPASAFIDSAAMSRFMGYGSSLEAAAPQILGIDKMASGKELIMLFSVPSKEREEEGLLEWDSRLPKQHPAEWDEFLRYCKLDAELSLRIAHELAGLMDMEEMEYNAITMEMNATGWPVDLSLVHRMKDQHMLNTAKLIDKFPGEANINSHKQMVEWCRERGIRATSFDEKSVERLVSRIEKRLASSPDMDPATRIKLIEVLQMLQIKQQLGGSSPKKLDTILRTVAADGRLYDQYLHAGAGATARTTGRGVQMQNLPRLHGLGNDVESLMSGSPWTNGMIADNLRQVFRAKHPEGRIIVGDFSSVESRALAWQAEEEWKLQAYRDGKDLYKELASKFFHRRVEDIDRDERTFGKVGELSCGYGAGGDAVRSFAEKMGVSLSEEEAADLVRDWRRVNSSTEEYWHRLDTLLHTALSVKGWVYLDKPTGGGDMTVAMCTVMAPQSLIKQTGDQNLRSLHYQMTVPGLNRPVLQRVVHGVHAHGRNIRYWKPSDRKTGDLWKDTFVDPKTGQLRWFSLYGGKMAGLLTQSLCRELFFMALNAAVQWAREWDNVKVIGQFHDEIVLEWQPVAFDSSKRDPRCISHGNAVLALQNIMQVERLAGFPMAAEIKSDARYTK